LPKPGGERELGILASRLHSTPLDRHRPLWAMHVVERLENDEFAIFLKLHHARIDGLGAVKLLHSALSKDHGARKMPAFGERARAPSWSRPPPQPAAASSLRSRRRAAMRTGSATRCPSSSPTPPPTTRVPSSACGRFAGRARSPRYGSRTSPRGRHSKRSVR